MYILFKFLSIKRGSIVGQLGFVREFQLLEFPPGCASLISNGHQSDTPPMGRTVSHGCCAKNHHCFFYSRRVQFLFFIYCGLLFVCVVIDLAEQCLVVLWM